MTRYRYLVAGALGNYGGEGDSMLAALVACYGKRIANELFHNGARTDEWDVSDEEDSARECTLYQPDGAALGTFYELRAL